MKPAFLILLMLSHLALLAQPFKRCKDYPGFPEPNPALGNTYYVAVSGNNNNPGSFNSPWKTIGHAMNQMQPGDITYVRAGIYKETNLKFGNSGTVSKPITLSAYKSGGEYEEVVLEGPGAGQYWGIIMDSGDYYTIQGIIVRNFTKQGIKTQETVSGHYKGIRIRDVEIFNTGIYPNTYSNGLLLNSVDDFIVDNVRSHNNRGSGVLVQGNTDTSGAQQYAQNGWIVNSWSYDNDDGASDADGFYIGQGKDIAICNCMAAGNTDQGFDVSDPAKGGLLSHHITLENNVATANPSGFSANSDSHHILYLRNLAYGNIVNGFVGYEGVGAMQYYYNVAMCNKYQGLEIKNDYAVNEDPGDNTITLSNNIFFYNDIGNGNSNEIEIANGNPSNYNVTVSYNNFFPNGSEPVLAWVGNVGYTTANLSVLGPGNLNQYPVFTDASCGGASDVHLQEFSPLIDAGKVISINNSAEPYHGSAPDMGVFEFGVSGLDEIVSHSSSISVSPNPFDDFTLISFANPGGKEFAVSLFNAQGQLVRGPFPTCSSQAVFERSGLPAGLYYCVVAGSGGSNRCAALVIQ